MSDSKTRSFDLSKYGPRTVSTFSVLGSYFVNMFYNHFYVEAIKLQEKHSTEVKSITDGYRHVVGRFLSVIDMKQKTTYDKKLYHKLLMEINGYFTTNTKFSSFTVSESIAFIIKEFLPPDMFKGLTADQKKIVMRKILVTTTQNFAIKVCDEYLSHVIDKRDIAENVDLLKEEMTGILSLQREDYYQGWLDAQANRKRSEKVNVTLVKRIQKDLQACIKENRALKSAIKNACAERDAQRDNAKALVKKYKILHARYKQEKKKNALLAAKLAEPQERYSEYDFGNRRSSGRSRRRRRPPSEESSEVSDLDESDSDAESHVIADDDSDDVSALPTTGTSNGSAKNQEPSKEEMDALLSQHRRPPPKKGSSSSRKRVPRRKKKNLSGSHDNETASPQKKRTSVIKRENSPGDIPDFVDEDPPKEPPARDPSNILQNIGKPRKTHMGAPPPDIGDIDAVF